MKPILLAAAVLACAHAPVRNAKDDEAQIRARLEKWVEQFNTGDYAGAATIWAPDLVGWMGGAPDDTYQREMEAAKRAVPAEAPQFALTIDEIIVEGDLAVVRDTWRETLRDRKMIFHSFEVWRRQPDGQWKIARWIDAAPEPD